jgi:broad specificity phosphatase PhoE
VSDLFCAATVVFARHAEAEYLGSRFSDEGGTLTWRGRHQAAALAETLAGRRIARIWCSDLSRAVQTAEVAAAHLGVGVVTHPALREVDVGQLRGRPFDPDVLRAVTDRWAEGDLTAAFPGGEDGTMVVDRVSRQLREIADEHRGETVLVIGHESAGCAALASMATGLLPPYEERLRRLSHAETVEVMIDADGVALLRWGDRVTAPPAG